MKTLFAILYPGIYILCMMLLVAIVYNVLWLTPVFQIFSDARYIRNYMKKPQTFWDLPEPVKKIYLYELSSRGRNRAIVNLDSNITTMSYQDLDTHGLWPSKTQFTIGKKKFILPFNGNKESYPFILYKKSLYYLASMYVNKHKIEYAEYGVIPLEKYLEY